MFVYSSIAVMFDMVSIGLSLLSRIVQSYNKADPNLQKLKLDDVKIPRHYRSKRLLILGGGFLIVLLTFCSQFDSERGLNEPDRVQTPPFLINNSTSSLIGDARDVLEGGNVNERCQFKSKYQCRYLKVGDCEVIVYLNIDKDEMPVDGFEDGVFRYLED